MQIFVLGMHRSGTSALARLLNLAGCEFGPHEAAMPPDVDNPLGFWERLDAYELHEWLLGTCGAAWGRPLAFDPCSAAASVRGEFHRRALRIVESFPDERPWFLKDPRLCLTLPLWRPLVPRPVCVHILRHPLEVASSLAARNALPMRVGLALWELHLVRARLSARGLPWIGVGHRDLLADPVGTLADVVAGLRACGGVGIRMPVARDVTAFVSVSLHRHRWNRGELAEWLDTPQVRLFQTINEAGSKAIPDEPSPATIDALRRHEAEHASGLNGAEHTFTPLVTA